jgi:hypothetical protein
MQLDRYQVVMRSVPYGEGVSLLCSYPQRYSGHCYVLAFKGTSDGGGIYDLYEREWAHLSSTWNYSGALNPNGSEEYDDSLYFTVFDTTYNPLQVQLWRFDFATETVTCLAYVASNNYSNPKLATDYENGYVYWTYEDLITDICYIRKYDISAETDAPYTSRASVDHANSLGCDSSGNLHLGYAFGATQKWDTYDGAWSNILTGHQCYPGYHGFVYDVTSQKVRNADNSKSWTSDNNTTHFLCDYEGFPYSVLRVTLFPTDSFAVLERYFADEDVDAPKTFAGDEDAYLGIPELVYQRVRRVKSFDDILFVQAGDGNYVYELQPYRRNIF